MDCPIPGHVLGQARWGIEQTGLVEVAVPMPEAETKLPIRSTSTQTRLWFYACFTKCETLEKGLLSTPSQPCQQSRGTKQQTWSSVLHPATRSPNPQLPFPSMLNCRLCTTLCLCKHVSMYTERGRGEGVEICSVTQPRIQDSWGQTDTQPCPIVQSAHDPQSWEGEAVAADLNPPFSPLTLCLKCSSDCYAPCWIYLYTGQLRHHLLLSCVKAIEPSEDMLSKHSAAEKGALKHMLQPNMIHFKLLPEYFGPYNNPGYYSWI